MKLVSTTLLLALSAIAASAAAPNARYVRVELPGNGKTLTLAEVEVISKGKNIAKSGKATQSSVGAGGVPERAIDGNKNPSYTKVEGRLTPAKARRTHGGSLISANPRPSTKFRSGTGVMVSMGGSPISRLPFSTPIVRLSLRRTILRRRKSRWILTLVKKWR